MARRIDTGGCGDDGGPSSHTYSAADRDLCRLGAHYVGLRARWARPRREPSLASRRSALIWVSIGAQLGREHAHTQHVRARRMRPRRVRFRNRLRDCLSSIACPR